MKKTFLFLGALFFALSATLYAQPRPIEKSEKPAARTTTAPASFAAKYEGGIFGFSNKIEGTLRFDDENERFVFFDEAGKEQFSLPYRTLLLIYPQSKSVRSTAGTVISAIPLPGAGLAGFIREKRRYLIVHFEDPDVDVKGVANFKLANKELLDAVLEALGAKAGLSARGDAYYRPKNR